MEYDITSSIPPHRLPKKRLRVTFPNGDSICYKSASITFIETLKRIGSNRFPEIVLELAYLPLISKEKHTKLGEYMKPIIDGWYLNIQSDTHMKYMQLLSINDQLKLGLKVEIGSDLEITNKIEKEKKTKCPKSSLLVQLPDGEFIAEESPIETFIQTIFRIGIEKLQRKEIMITGKPLITIGKQYNGQVQIGKNQWLTIPSSTKEKAKILNILALIMHLELKITII